MTNTNLPSLQLVKYPNPILRKKALPVETIDESIANIGLAMLNLMYEYKGIGLAGNQAGILQRIIVIDLQENEEHNPFIMINPVIVNQSEDTVPYEEGCLSLPQIKSELSRSKSIDVSYLDIHNVTHRIVADGLFATCIQHEIDHLNGILFVDRLSKLKKDLLLSKYKKLQKEAQAELIANGVDKLGDYK